MKKNICVPVIYIIACVAVFFSCDKSETKPIQEVIVGKWVFDDYTTDSEQLKRDFAIILKWMDYDTVPVDFGRIMEFTASGRYLLYNATDMPVVPSSEEVNDEGEFIPSSPFEKGTYVFEGDVLLVSDHLDVNDGFPFPKARGWVNNNNWISLSAKIADYVDVEYIIKTLPLKQPNYQVHQDLENDLRTGNIQVSLRRYVEEK
jgi:hypothetical protein